MENKNIESANNLSKEEIERYCRQIILPEIFPQGQERISKAKVLVVGAGGLGSPCLMYLAGAGIGEIGIIDGDAVDTSNLHRQVIHMNNNKGINKAKSAKMLINQFNPLTKVNIYEEHLNNTNALRICKEYDLLIDCCDNPATRYLTSDICVILNKPLVSGSAVQWEGQLTVYVKDNLDDLISNKLPCYRCLFPIPTPQSAVCNCSEGGVFGPVPGVIGTMQANEAVKLILGASDKILAKRMMTYDAYEMNFKIFKLRNFKSECNVCGENRTITLENIEEFDYDEFVNPKISRQPKRVDIPEENNINWKEFLNKLNNLDLNDNLNLIDVRPKEQFNMFTLNLKNNYKFHNIPMKEFNDDIISFKTDQSFYIVCRAGNQSTHATKVLLEKGFKNVFNIQDGIHGYIKEMECQETPFY